MIRVNRKVLSHMLNYGAPLQNCVERVGKLCITLWRIS